MIVIIWQPAEFFFTTSDISEYFLLSFVSVKRSELSFNISTLSPYFFYPLEKFLPYWVSRIFFLYFFSLFPPLPSIDWVQRSRFSKLRKSWLQWPRKMSFKINNIFWSDILINLSLLESCQSIIFTWIFLLDGLSIQIASILWILWMLWFSIAHGSLQTYNFYGNS